MAPGGIVAKDKLGLINCEELLELKNILDF